MYVLFSCFLSAFVEASFFVLIFSLKGHIYVIYAVYVFLIMYVLILYSSVSIYARSI